MPFSKMSWTAGIALALTGVSHNAAALDGQDFGEKLAASIAAIGGDFSFESASVSGDRVTLSGNRISQSDQISLEAPGNIVFEGVRETGDGGYLASAARIADLAINERHRVLSVQNLEFLDVGIPADVEDHPALTNPFLANIHYGAMSFGPLTYREWGKTLVSLATYRAVKVVNEPSTEQELSFQLDGINADLSTISNPTIAAMLDLLGLQTMSGRISGEGSWDPSDSRVRVRDYAVIIDDVAKLNLTLDFTGYNIEFEDEMEQLDNSLADHPEYSPAEIEGTRYAAIMTAIGKFEVLGASLRYEDGSLAQRLLELFADVQSTDRVVLAATIAEGVLGAAADAGAPPKFQSMLLEAVQSFLIDPKSFEIRMAPASPVPASEFASATTTYEVTALIDRLNISVTANR